MKPPYKKKKDIVITKKGLALAHIGTGKGKTTAAMGIAVRASGAGLNVHIIQFVKAAKPKEGEKLKPGEWPLSNEIKFFNLMNFPKPLGAITTDQVGAGFVGILGDRKEKEYHIREALKGLQKSYDVLKQGHVDVLILDEILSAVELGLLTEEDVIDILKKRPTEIHIVLTGHNKFPKIFKLCDTVTEMKMVKHAYYEGVLAQVGIDF